jgi:hypothetical protein
LPAYLILLATLPALLDERFGRHARRWEMAAHGFAWPLTLATFLWLGLATSPQLAARFAGSQIYPDNFLGWQEVAKEVRPELRDDIHLVADNFMLAAQLAFALDAGRGVYSLDHLLNTKHGRARQLHDWGYDEAAIRRLPAGSQVLLVVEDSATLDPQKREAWRERLCQFFADITPLRTVVLSGGAKRFSLYRGRTRTTPAASCPVPLPANPSPETG